MQYNRDVHHRRSIRLRGFDYSQPGAYFITVCTHQRAPLFGGVVDGAMVLNDAGIMVDTVWRALPQHYPGVELGEHVVMPNHFHGIVHITAPAPVIATVGAGPRACPRACCSPDQPWQPQTVVQSQTVGQPQGVAPTGLSLGGVVHRFKSLTTRRYAESVVNQGWSPFHGRLWQRNYYEHIIRNEQAYAAIADYIRHNPQRWREDVYCTEAADR